MENAIVKINVLELASELASKELFEGWSSSMPIYADEDANVLTYTDEAQDVFNDLYDYYLDKILQCKED